MSVLIQYHRKSETDWEGDEAWVCLTRCPYGATVNYDGLWLQPNVGSIPCDRCKHHQATLKSIVKCSYEEDNQ